MRKLRFTILATSLLGLGHVALPAYAEQCFSSSSSVNGRVVKLDSCSGGTGNNISADQQGSYVVSVFGQKNTITNASAAVFGNNNNVTGNNGTAVGSNNIVSGASGLALGYSAQATATNAVALGSGSIADEADTVSVGSAASRRRITNVADGINANDAVNYSQLRAVQQDAWSRLSLVNSGMSAFAQALGGRVLGRVHLHAAELRYPRGELQQCRGCIVCHRQSPDLAWHGFRFGGWNDGPGRRERLSSGCAQRLLRYRTGVDQLPHRSAGKSGRCRPTGPSGCDWCNWPAGSEGRYRLGWCHRPTRPSR